MSDTSAEVLDFLRAGFARMDARFDRIERKVDELTVRVGALEIALAGIKRDIAELHGTTAHLSVRLDSQDAGLDRIERRLELREPADR